MLSISSQVAFGPVGNSAAVPALQARGHAVLAVPTVMLSNHPGHGKPEGFRTSPADLAAILRRAISFAPVDAVLTGYFASPEQVAETADVIGSLRQQNAGLYVLVDPVAGDGEAFYVPEPVAVAIRDILLPQATCLTPNRFELEWLSGKPAGSIAAATAAARSLAIPEVLATSIPAEGGHLATLLVKLGAVYTEVRALLPHVPHGTGDFLAGAYLAERLISSPPDALRFAQQRLDRAIARSAGSSALDVAGDQLGA